MGNDEPLAVQIAKLSTKKQCDVETLTSWAKYYSLSANDSSIKQMIDILIVNFHDICIAEFKKIVGIGKEDRDTGLSYSLAWRDLSQSINSKISAKDGIKWPDYYELFLLINNIEEISLKAFNEILGKNKAATQETVDKIIRYIAGTYIAGHCEFLKTAQMFFKIWPHNLPGQDTSTILALNRLTVYCAIKDFKVQL